MDAELKLNNLQWKWKRWDVRADGMVFWCYNKSCPNNEWWISWDHAVKRLSNAIVQRKKYRSTDKWKQYQRIYQRENRREYHRKYQIKYRLTKKYKERNSNYKKTKRLTDPIFAISDRLRRRTSAALNQNGYSKTSKTHEILGCSWEHLKYHLESQFREGMTWENRSKWHIDHIIPLASANSEEELMALCNYKNLQPLWAADNLRKGDKICANLLKTGQKVD